MNVSDEGEVMKVPKVFLAAILATGVLMPSIAGPATAAASYGGAGTPLSISTYNFYRTGFLPIPPSSVPLTSTITGVSYKLDWYSRGGLDAQLCSSSSNCTTVSPFSSSTTYFNGMSAGTALYFRVAWKDFLLSGSLPGGPVDVTTSLTVNYS